MAILSNGKFYGFLCSAKETGQKLANGVKEYVEDFVSGFAGHGWKIWEYVKGKWMLEIDSIRVRGQFTVFEMLISKVRAIIGAQAITQGCGKVKTAELSEDGTAYLITLEDADMSFMEHDFIRCQEFTGSQKVYHVEIESVTDGIIRVPLSEFDLDEEGIALNPPAPGDDIVQFGNSSHDEKYVGRHSAIYMHADEGLQPAIDVLDEIYSKDMSDCLKARFGGDIPGGDGARGFYSVNGMIKGVDKSGHTTYCLYPDGTAELGDKSALFKPNKSGYIAGGAIAWEWSEEEQKCVCTMKDVVLTWDNLDNEVKDNLKGEKGEKGDDGLQGVPGEPGKDANLLSWIKKWNGYATELGEEYIVTPKMFSGVKSSTGKLTGIIQGKDCLTDKTTGKKRTGMFAIVDDEIVFELDPIIKKYLFKGLIETEGAIIKTSLLQDVKITGTINQPWSRSGIYINVGSDEKMAFDNIAAGASGGWGDGSINSMVTWTTNDNGRIMRIANWKFDGETFDGSVDISAPSGKYFFEDGVSKSKIALSREVVELMGYGDSRNFYGYIVLNRINFMTTSKYGRKLNVLAQGIVTGTNSSASIKYKTFDGSTMSASRTGEVGLYNVYFSNQWGLDAENYIVMLTGYGCAYGISTPLKANLAARYSSSFSVYTSDDSTRNDGSFMFQLINLNDWS